MREPAGFYLQIFTETFYPCVTWSSFSLNLTYRHFFRFFNFILLQDKENAYATNTFLFSDCNRKN